MSGSVVDQREVLSGRSLDELESDLKLLEEVEGSVHALRSEVLAEIDRRKAWKLDGCRDLVEWATAKHGWSPSMATKRVRLARSVSCHVDMAKRLRSGELCFDRAALIASALSPALEDRLVEAACTLSWKQLVQFVQGLRDVEDEDAEKAHRDRGLHFRGDDGGISTRLYAKGPSALLAPLIGAIHTEMEKDSPEEKRTDTIPARRLDALLRLTDRGRSAKGRPSRTDFMVHVDLDLLEGFRPGSGVIPRIGAMAKEDVRRLIGEGRVSALLKRDGVPVNLDETEYRASPKLFQYLLWRDGGCRFPGCQHRWWLDVHHILTWPKGPTTPANTILLCKRHHQMIEKQGWTIRGSPEQTLTFENPNGRRLAG